jgi:hypothetical protein
MAASTTTRVGITRRFHSLNVPLASDVSAVYRGNRVSSVPGSFTCAEPGHTTKMHPLGKVAADVATAGDNVPIELEAPIECLYLDSDTGISAPVLATDFMKPIYYKDDHTFTLTLLDGSGKFRQFAGLLIDVNTRDGVGVWLQPVLAHDGLVALIS